MKTYTNKELKTKINQLGKAITRYSVLPILESIMFKSGYAHTTDLDVGVAVRFEFEGEPFCVEYAMLKKIVVAIPNDSYTFAHKDGVLLIQPFDKKLDALRFAIKIKTEPIADFPSLKFLDEKHKSEEIFTQSDIDKIIATIPFVGNDDLRPSMTGVYLEAGKATATDAHVLIHQTLEERSVQFTKRIMPKKAIEFIKFMKAKFVQINETEKQYDCLAFENGTTYWCRRIDANYPDYKAVIKPLDEFPIKFDFDAENLLQIVNLSKFAIDHKDAQVVIEIDKECLTFKVDVATGAFAKCDFEMSMPITSVRFDDDKPMKVGFMHSKLFAVLKTLPRTSTWRFINPKNQTQLNYNVLLMPMVISA